MIKKVSFLAVGLFFVFATFVFVQDITPASALTYANPLKPGFTSLGAVLGGALVFMQKIIVVLATIFIIVGAVLYITSAGNESQMKTAKSAITAALIGLALGIAAPSFLKEISGALGWIDVAPQVAAAQTLTAVAMKVLNFLLSITGIIAIIMMVIGGFTYLTAAGDEGKSEVGKKIVTYAIIGVLVSLGSLVIVTQIARFF